MTDEEKITKCIELVWDFEENYDGDDLLNFQNKELSTYTQHESVVTTFNKYIRLEKENKSLGERVLQLEKDKGKLIDENAEIKEALNNHPETASVTQLMELIQVREENKRQKTQITELEKRINTLKIKNASLQKKNEQQAKQIEKMKADVSNLVEHQGVVYANDIAAMYSKWEIKE